MYFNKSNTSKADRLRLFSLIKKQIMTFGEFGIERKKLIAQICTTHGYSKKFIIELVELLVDSEEINFDSGFLCYNKKSVVEVEYEKNEN